MNLKDLFSARSSRFRFILASCIVLITMAHFVLSALSVTGGYDDEVAVITSLAAVAATLLSLMLARGVSRHPGIEAAGALLPAWLLGYGMLLTVFLLSRAPYSRALLVTDFVLTLLWALGARTLARRQRLQIGVVPQGAYEALTKLPQLDCVLLKTGAADEMSVVAVAADLQTDLDAKWDRFLAECALSGIPVYHTKHLVESLTGRVELVHLSENSFGMLTPVSAFMAVKHAVDWASALILGMVMAPALALVALAVRLDSNGPAIFRQRRVGYRGEPFTVYKFRTMTIDGHDEDDRESAKTQSRDRRITRLGHILRRTRIDELPQIWNILRGEMSWIGPRPEAKVLSDWYARELPFYPYRHIVRPGITGWAQVNQGHVAEINDVREKLYYDFYYIKHYSLWLDLIVVLKTFQTVISGSGAK
jgi:lipopolysaccharide/colanic/teichoic acid biosynthesis glycosyltransferase